LIRDLNGAARDASALWAVLSDSIDGLNAALITNEAASLQAVAVTPKDQLERILGRGARRLLTAIGVEPVEAA
jgi:hypothetical protein